MLASDFLSIRNIRAPDGTLRAMAALLAGCIALVSVDASACAASSGHFDILFSHLKENAPDMDFVERFTWKPGLMEVAVDFWADEAVDGYWLSHVAACPCRE